MSVQIIDKTNGYHVLKTIGSSSDLDKIEQFIRQGNWWIQQQSRHQLKLFPLQTQDEQIIEGFLSELSNAQVRTVGPELIFGTLFDRLGFQAIPDELFRHLVIARLAFPSSKLKTVDYLYRYQGVVIRIDTLYRFLDKLKGSYQEKIEQLAYAHTRKILAGNINVIFYDLTTLYFEADSEDDLRRIGYSKDGKFNQPQIMIGLLVGEQGYPIGYTIFEGNTYEGHTLIPVIKQFETKFNLKKPIVVADAAMLSKDNLQALAISGYTYIVGARIKNESETIKQQILSLNLNDQDSYVIPKEAGIRLIVSYSDKRAGKDCYNRERGLKRLEKTLKAGRLTKQHINNRGYNKLLKLNGKVTVTIDYQKYLDDQKWDGLKGYLTNSGLESTAVIDNYNQLWQIEKAFRISKTDLRVRPVYHRLRGRIEAHICIAFTAYTIYKELERLLNHYQVLISPSRAAELTHTMYALEYRESTSTDIKTILLKMDEEQQQLYDTINR